MVKLTISGRRRATAGSAREQQRGPFCWCAIALCTAVSACTAAGTAGNQSAAVYENKIPALVPELSDAEGNLYFPQESYRKYPAQVRELIRRNEMEDGRCSGPEDAYQEKYRACNRRHRLLLELERRGWCWGGKTGIGVDNRWLPCSEDPYYRNHHVSNELPFPEVE